MSSSSQPNVNIPDYTDGSQDGNSVACATVFPSDTIISMIQHPYLLLKFGQSLKPWNKLKIQLHPNVIFYRHTFVSPSFTVYEAGTSLDWGGDMKVCLFKCC